MNVNNRFLPFIAIFIAMFFAPVFRTRAAAVPLKLPYGKGQRFVVVQGYHSLPTHIKKDAFALDFSQNGCDAYGKAAVAAAPGKVMFMSEEGYNGGYGTEIIIDHGNHIVSRYAHLIPGSIPAVPGETVMGGQVIGRIGDTGLVAGMACSVHPGTHLHFAMDTVQPDGTFLAYDPEPLSGYEGIREGTWYLSDNDGSAAGAVLGASTTAIVADTTATAVSATSTAVAVATTTVSASAAAPEIASGVTNIIPPGAVAVILPPVSPIAFTPVIETPIATSTFSATSTVPSASSTPPLSSPTSSLPISSSTTSAPPSPSSSITAPGDLSFQFDELGMNLMLSFGSSTDAIWPDDPIHYEMNYSTSTSLSVDGWQLVSPISVSMGNAYLVGVRAEDDHGKISDVATATWDFPAGFTPYVLSREIGDARQYFTVQTTSTLDSIDIFTTNFMTSAKNPNTPDCFLSLLYDGFIPPIPADNEFVGYGCDGDLRYSFASSSITLSPGKQYQWIFKADTENLTSGASVMFYGTMTDTAGGPFSDPSIKNAKFTITGDAGILFSN